MSLLNSSNTNKHSPPVFNKIDQNNKHCNIFSPDFNWKENCANLMKKQNEILKSKQSIKRREMKYNNKENLFNEELVYSGDAGKALYNISPLQNDFKFMRFGNITSGGLISSKDFSINQNSKNEV